MMRRAARTDTNHETIMLAFRRLGCSVRSTHQLGSGFPDLIVAQKTRTDAHDSVTYLVEIKDGTKSPSRRKLTQDETEFHAQWRGRVYIVENLYDVAAVIRSAALENA